MGFILGGAVAIVMGMAIALSGIGILAILGRQTIDRRFQTSARQLAIAAGLRFEGQPTPQGRFFWSSLA